MDGELRQHAETQHNVKCHPRKCEPSRPVLSAKHEGSGDNGQKLGEFNPDAVRLPQITKVPDKASDAYRKVQAGENED